MESSGGNQGTGPRPGLELDEDPPFTRASWRAERGAWAVMVMILAAALAGLFGNGPASWRTAGGADDPLRVTYERFVRRQAPVILRVRIGPGHADAEGRIRLWISRGYLNGVKVERITPEPEWVETAPDRTVFVLRLAEPAGPAEATLRLEMESVGPLRAVAGLDSPAAPGVEFSQFAYP